ncbi:hypothetical protein VNO80_11869 [Phaseolus coccineus]|uniref:Uncharacterized protein n=1 Tax=Phaseolus coccineus TaxID=3886 RepID=A0AAN9NAY3_PHACN
MYSLSSEGNEIMGENFFCVCRLHHTLATDILAAFRWKQGSNSTSKTNLSYFFLPTALNYRQIFSKLDFVSFKGGN